MGRIKQFFLISCSLCLVIGCTPSEESGDDGDDNETTTTSCGTTTVSPVVSFIASDGTFSDKVQLSWSEPFVTETVDNDGASGAHGSIAIDNQDTVHIAYYGNLTTGGRLMHAWRTTTECWQTEIVDDGAADVGQFTDLAVAEDGTLHISYYDATNQRVKHAFGTAENWQTEVVASGVTPGLQSTSFAVSPEDGTLHIVYRGSSLDHAYRTGGAWIVEEVAATMGQYAALEIESSGMLHILYQESTQGGLGHAYGSIGDWDFATIDSGGVGTYIDFAISGSFFIASYYDFDGEQLKAAVRGAGGIWTTEVVDTVGSVGMHNSVAIHSTTFDLTFHLAYYDADGTRLQYATRSVSAASWNKQTLDGAGTTGQWTGVAVDSNGVIHINYYDLSATSLNRAFTGAEVSYQLARRESGSGDDFAVLEDNYTDQIYDDASVTPEVVYEYQLIPSLGSSVGDEILDTGFAVPAQSIDADDDVGTHNAIAISGDGTIHIAYYDDTANDLKHAFNPDGDPSNWQIEVVDSEDNVGQHASIAVDSNNDVHIMYWNQSDGSLKHAVGTADGADFDWTIAVVDEEDFVGLYTSLVIDDEDTLHVSYQLGGTDSDLKYATKTIDGTWTTQTVDSDDEVGVDSSIGVAGDGSLHITYYDGTNGNLKYAEGIANGDLVGWTTATIDSSSDVGTYSAIRISPTNRLHVAYFDDTNNRLKHAWKDLADDDWNEEVVDTASSGFVGKFTSIALDNEGDVHIIYYGNNSARIIHASGAWDGTSYTWTAEDLDDTVIVGAETGIALGGDGTLHVSYYDGANTALKYTALNP